MSHDYDKKSFLFQVYRLKGGPPPLGGPPGRARLAGGPPLMSGFDLLRLSPPPPLSSLIGPLELGGGPLELGMGPLELC